MKRITLSLSIFSLLAADACLAAQITPDEAVAAARNWLKGEAMIAEGISTEPEGVQTVENDDGSAYHVVSLVGGGFVVLAADDGIEPVVAFSATGAFPEAHAGGPVRALLARDMGERTAGLNAAAGTFKRMAFASAANMMATPEAKWAMLRTAASPNTKRRAYASGRASVSDVRVEPLVKSKWGQERDTGYSNKGSPCYNSCTPNQYPCGCVPTAMAQLLRYWQYPLSVRAFAHNCEVDGCPTVLSAAAGPYDWDDMPLDPSQGTSPAQRLAIGKLTYDCGVALCTSYSKSGSGALGCFAFKPLLEDFGYANAMAYCPPNDISNDEIQQSVFPNLDAGCPVMIGFSDGYWDLHEAVADGYGYVSGTAYVHLNVGWTAISGSDLWYNLPDVTFTMAEASSSSYSIIDHFIYNVLPDETGDILSGRVTDETGAPAAGVEVTVRRSGKATVLATAKTSQHGIYAFVLPGGAKYDVTAGGTTRKGVLLKKSVNPSKVNLETGTCTLGQMACGNSWGNDFVLSETPGPGPDPSGDPSVEVSCGLDGAELVLGQTVTLPVEINCTACSVKSVKASGLPSGLKFVSGKTAAPYDYAIVGTPKKASLKPFKVKLTVQAKADAAGVKMPNTVVEYAVYVLPLDDWAVGTFSGIAEVGDTPAAFTMTVKNTGAISGKITVGKKGYPFKASGFSCVEESCYRVEVNGVVRDSLAIDIVPQAFGDGKVGVISNGCVSAAQEIWKLKAYKKFLQKYTSPDKTLSWTAAGKVTWQTTSGATGKKVKLTATLLPVSYEGGEIRLCAYFIDGETVTRLDVSYDDEGKNPTVALRNWKND